MPTMLVLAILIKEFLLNVPTFSFLAGHKIQQAKNNKPIIFNSSKITQSFVQFLELKLTIFNRQISTYKRMVLIHIDYPKTWRLELCIDWSEEYGESKQNENQGRFDHFGRCAFCIGLCAVLVKCWDIIYLIWSVSIFIFILCELVCQNTDSFRYLM